MGYPSTSQGLSVGRQAPALHTELLGLLLSLGRWGSEDFGKLGVRALQGPGNRCLELLQNNRGYPHQGSGCGGAPRAAFLQTGSLSHRPGSTCCHACCVRDGVPMAFPSVEPPCGIGLTLFDSPCRERVCSEIPGRTWPQLHWQQLLHQGLWHFGGPHPR